MVFGITGKVALITGGASGIGLRFAKELLRNGLKAVALADVEPQYGKTATEEIEKEFGPNKAIYVDTNVTDIQQFEDAFKKTVDKFKNVDILVNNAGILNDKVWEKEIAINVNGVVHGILLGLENYLQKYRQGPEALIVNMSSIAGVGIVPNIPIYCGTKAAVIAMTKTWSDPVHYDRSKVRLIAVCPGATATPLMFDISGRNLGEPYEQWLRSKIDNVILQEPEYLVKEMIELVKNAGNGTVWVVEDNERAYEYIVPERETMQKNKRI